MQAAILDLYDPGPKPGAADGRTIRASWADFDARIGPLAGRGAAAKRRCRGCES